MFITHMGKKRQKMKELSVAIAEASFIQGAETGQQEIQPQLPRKRGRPRKIIAMEANQEKKIDAAEKGTENTMKKEEQEEEEEEEESIAACISFNSKEKEFQLITKGDPSRSRVRRKSKPRKST
ncbi:unnamed protein product [Lupinus luteus]|uniref:Uncharacterized protein n=1 Tax=Lupinus luteus TaxID=3873 RepID=A0AAV1XZ47_LUPLU